MKNQVILLVEDNPRDKAGALRAFRQSKVLWDLLGAQRGAPQLSKHMTNTLRVLHVEDQEGDAALVERHMSRHGYEVTSERVETQTEMRAALATREWDIILCEYSMPEFNALAALSLIREMELDIPFIIISGTIGEGAAVEAMRAGAHDYLMKDSLARLAPAIEREIAEAQNRNARRQAEEQLRLQSAAVRAAANAIVITDRAGKILWINPAFTQTTGYSSEQVHGRNLRLLKSGKQDRAFYREMWETILSGKVWRNTIINRHKDGTLNHEDLTITPIPDASGAITHFVGIKQNIGERIKAEETLRSKNEELASMTQQLWQASKLATMGELSASIAHELNNPLATVALRTEILLMQLPEDSEQRKPLEIITQEVDRMAVLVNNLLQFSRRSHRQISTLDPREEIANSLELVHYHLRTRKIEVLREFTGEIPTIQADRQQLRQLFLNLLTNASDAMPQGGRLTVRAACGTLNDGEAVVIEFADTGGGVTAENMEKLWEPFFTTKPEGKGTGLGLAICRRIVEEHGGTIDIQSQPGQGTTVRMNFPATGNGASI
jgi:two-component system, NtrC family, sensor kinase